jgi:hypothetical protein
VRPCIPLLWAETRGERADAFKALIGAERMTCYRLTRRRQTRAAFGVGSGAVATGWKTAADADGVVAVLAAAFLGWAHFLAGAFAAAFLGRDDVFVGPWQQPSSAPSPEPTSLAPVPGYGSEVGRSREDRDGGGSRDRVRQVASFDGSGSRAPRWGVNTSIELIMSATAGWCCVRRRARGTRRQPVPWRERRLPRRDTRRCLRWSWVRHQLLSGAGDG